MFGGKAQKHWKYIAQNQRLPLCQTNFGTRKKKKKQRKKETKRAGEIGWEILCYYILTKRIVKSAKPAYLTLPVVSSYRHVLGIALIKRNVLCNQREIRRIDN